MSMSSEFKAINAWEWVAICVLCVVMADYMSVNFPFVSLGCVVAAVMSAAMTFIRLNK